MLRKAAYFFIAENHIISIKQIKFNMLKSLLGNKVFEVLERNFCLDYIFEVRMRNSKPLVVNYNGIMVEPKLDGKPVIATSSDIERVISVASNFSLYTVENQIKQAFITAEKGYRIGISGEIVNNIGQSTIKTIKNVYSVNIRVPHKIENCSYKLFKYIASNSEFKNTLIISPPGAGKTTMIRDLCCQFSKLNSPVNILLLDERYEIAGVKNGNTSIDVGCYTDILSGASKDFGFAQGIRALKPDIIVTDELMGREDLQGVKYAINSGVKVIATIHAKNIEMLKLKSDFLSMINDKYFERYVVLSLKNNPGNIDSIYDENLKCLYT